MIKSIRNQTIALAGLSQAVYLVQQIAKHGVADCAAMESSISSILKIDAADIEDVYDGIGNISVGFRQLKKQLTGRDTINPEQAHYAASLAFLERKLMADSKIQRDLHIGIEKVQAIAENANVLDERVLTALADLYQGTISTLKPKIIISGEQIYLTNPENINKIRSLLLAGIRSAVLWRQCGGNRWKFILQRGRILDIAQKLAKSI